MTYSGSPGNTYGFLDHKRGYTLFNDFGAGALAAALSPLTNTNTATGAVTMVAGTLNDASTQGVVQALATATSDAAAIHGVATDINIGNGFIQFESRVRVEDLSNGTDTYTLRSGLGDSFVLAESTDFIGFRYTHGTNSGKFQGVTRSNSTETAIDTGVTVAADTWYVLKFVINAAGTEVKFYVNNVVVSTTITTNIPTGSSRLLGLMPIQIGQSAGTGDCIAYLDYFFFQELFNTSRLPDISAALPAS